MRTLAVLSLVLASCSATLPARLAGTVHRTEEQGIDYSGTHSSAFVLVLQGDGTGRAVRTTHAVDVYGSDAHETDETVRFTARAHRDGELLIVTLEQRDPAPACVAPLVLRCERWRTGSTVPEPTDASDRTLPGVEWVCALPSDRPFSLGLVTLQHVPREGDHLLLGETHVVHVEEEMSQGGRTVVTRIGAGDEFIGSRGAQLPSAAGAATPVRSPLREHSGRELPTP